MNFAFAFFFYKNITEGGATEVKNQDILTVAVINFKTECGRKEKNLQRMKGFAATAAKKGADMILFPEMCLMGYDYFLDENISIEEKIQNSERKDGPSARAMSEIAKQYNVYIIYGASEAEKDGALYNSAFVSGPDGLIGTYRKIHPFDAENKWCKKGDTPFLFDTPWGPVGIGICYDTYQFPELMRYYVQKGARLYLNPTAVIEEIPKEGSREAFLRYYASTLEYGVLCNTIFIASANLTGKDKESYFGGGSCVIGPKITPFFETDVTYYAGDKNNVQETLDLATIDLSLAKRRLCTINEVTGEPDYRPEIYRKLYGE